MHQRGGHMTDFKQFEFNDRKFRELVIYIAEKCADDPTFGATKLNKIDSLVKTRFEEVPAI